MKPVRLNRSEAAKARAREQRKAMSVGERWFWAAIRKDVPGFRFRRQHPAGPYFLDFYCPAAKLCVEVDGEQHSERVEADARRDALLAEFGILTLRIPSLDLFEKDRDLYSKWVRETERLCAERSAPSNKGESAARVTPSFRSGERKGQGDGESGRGEDSSR